MSFSVGRVAELAGVSVRTLHHYDDIGLLRPGERSPAGYRLYQDGDLVGFARSWSTESSASPSKR